MLDLLHSLHVRIEQDELPTAFTISQKALETKQKHRLSFTLEPSLLKDPISLDVCLTLNLLKKFERKLSLSPENIKLKVPSEFEPTIVIEVYYPSALGVEFLKACHPAISEKAEGSKDV